MEELSLDRSALEHSPLRLVELLEARSKEGS